MLWNTVKKGVTKSKLVSPTAQGLAKDLETIRKRRERRDKEETMTTTNEHYERLENLLFNEGKEKVVKPVVNWVKNSKLGRALGWGTAGVTAGAGMKLGGKVVDTATDIAKAGVGIATKKTEVEPGQIKKEPEDDEQQKREKKKKQQVAASYVRIGNLLKEKAQEKNNPYSICTASTGREDKAKYERCVKKVKKS